MTPKVPEKKSNHKCLLALHAVRHEHYLNWFLSNLIPENVYKNIYFLGKNFIWPQAYSTKALDIIIMFSDCNGQSVPSATS